MKQTSNNKTVPWYRSLVFSLILWFLPFSILPILIISYDSYQTNVSNLEKTAYHDIEQAALLEKKFLLNWFHYRFLDIHNWSTREENRLFIEELVDELHDYSGTFEEYIKSDKYIKSTVTLESDMLQLVRDYDYLYDLFLIDTDGNILYTVEKESDLGQNINSGYLGTTQFSKAFRDTLKDKKIHFSDLELYAPSANTVAGFITAPLYSRSGEFLGVFAVQIKLDRIYSIFSEDKVFNKYFTHYLVGSDGLLRSKFESDDEILKRKIDTKQFQMWQESLKNPQKKTTQAKGKICEYLDPTGQRVFGLYTDVDILGVEWALISEAKIEPIQQLKNEIIKRTIFYIFTVLAILSFVVIGISRYIAKPIIELSTISERFANGERDIELKGESESQSEVGLLTRRFYDMIRTIKKGENELDEQKHALNAHSIVAITDPNGVITYVNEKFVMISGYSREELLGKNHRILNSGEKSREYWGAMYKTISSGKIWHDELKNIAKDGSEYWVDTTIVPFMDENNKPKSYVVIRTDITQKKRDEAELIAAKAVAEESVKVKSEFFASMSHEIRTPMNGVIGMLGLLLNTPLTDSQRHQAYLAKTSANALLNLINDILDFSKVEAGKMELEKIPFNVRREFGDFAEASAFKAQEKGIEVVLDMTEVDSMMLVGDIGRIRQVLNNIVGNAIKFTSKGYVFIDVALFKQGGKRAKLEIRVEDTGIGIPEDKIATLFDSFSQVDASTTRKYGGTGLGLAIVKKLCALMDGKVSVTSEHGKGSQFFIELFIELPEESTLVLPRVPVKDKKVAIIDRCMKSYEALKHQLTYWGMRVTHFEDSNTLLKTEGVEFDIIFVSKDENSLDFAAEIKEKSLFGSPKLVLMTLLKESSEVAIFLASGYTTHFPKPATTDDILGALDVLNPEYGEESSAIALPNPLESESTSWSEDLKILLVDDNKVNQLVANGILEELGLEADVANNGREAIEMLKQASDSPYTLVLMDCQMPEMDGYEATEAIRSGEAGEIYKEIPVIAMTANAMDGDKEKCIVSGMDDYLSKPIDPLKLEDMLEKYS